ncbi:MAG: hypothetical protein K2O42_10525 [Oscillospiraceae bacterium]|nr:hypothetical protein [Oscillospiraceae bacterium]
MLGKNQQERYWLAFSLGFLSLAVVLLPLLIMDQGYFIYYGDFVSQQLPFYQHANEVVRKAVCSVGTGARIWGAVFWGLMRFT